LGVLQVIAGEEGKRGGSRSKSTPPLGFFVTVARGEDALPLFIYSQKSFSAIPGVLGNYFVIFELYLVYFKFLLFWNM
jgi:hypothetical protein